MKNPTAFSRYRFLFNCSILIGLLFISNFSIAQGGCVGGTATTLSPTIYYGNNATVTLNVPTGSFQWQTSSDNSNWTNASGGMISNTNNSASAGTTSFTYTGSVQTYIVPAGVTSITATGLGGAGGSATVRAGGLGGKLISDLLTTPGETLHIYVGQKGFNGCCGSSGLGGYNGGGTGANSEGGGGGGATDIRQGGVDLNNRIFVVGGGGGAGQQRSGALLGGVGGNGGGLIGQNGSNGSSRGGQGGTQSQGGTGYPNNGTLASGGNGGSVSGRAGGGGGGGLYGGGGGESGNGGAGSGGGGGSSYSIGTNTTNIQGSSEATGDGSLVISYNIPASVTSSYTISLTSPTYFRAEVTDGACVAYSTSVLIGINPHITITNPITALTTCLGSTSSPTTFEVNGSYLTSGIIITAPLNFEISTSLGGSFSSSLTLTPTSGTVSQTLFTRLSSSASYGVYSNTITATSIGAINVIATVNGTVYAPPILSSSSISICPEATYLITKTAEVPGGIGWAASPQLTISDGYLTAGVATGTNLQVTYTDGCSQTASATVTIVNTSNINSINSDRIAYKFNGNPQGPTLSGSTVNYIGYDGYTYFSQTQPTQVGFYKANIQSGNEAGCPNRFYIFTCTTCGN